MKIHPYLSEFRDYLTTTGYSGDMVNGHIFDVGMFVSWIETHLAIEFDYSIMSISTLYAYVKNLVFLSNNGFYKKSTVVRKLQAISCYLLWAKDNGYIDNQVVYPISRMNLLSGETILVNATE